MSHHEGFEGYRPEVEEDLFGSPTEERGYGDDSREHNEPADAEMREGFETTPEQDDMDDMRDERLPFDEDEESFGKEVEEDEPETVIRDRDSLDRDEDY